jgi:hypothetical protein
MARGILQRLLRETPRAQQDNGATQFGAGPRGAFDAQALEGVLEFGNRLGAMRVVALQERTHCGDTRVLAMQQMQGVGAIEVRPSDTRRAQRANAHCARTGGRVPRDMIE